MDCFAGKDGTQYDLIPDLEILTALPPVTDLSYSKQKKKKKKKVSEAEVHAILSFVLELNGVKR